MEYTIIIALISLALSIIAFSFAIYRLFNTLGKFSKVKRSTLISDFPHINTSRGVGRREDDEENLDEDIEDDSNLPYILQ